MPLRKCLDHSDELNYGLICMQHDCGLVWFIDQQKFSFLKREWKTFCAVDMRNVFSNTASYMLRERVC